MMGYFRFVKDSIFARSPFIPDGPTIFKVSTPRLDNDNNKAGKPATFGGDIDVTSKHDIFDNLTPFSPQYRTVESPALIMILSNSR